MAAKNELSPMARAVAYLIKIAAEDEEADPGVILADGPGPAGSTNGQRVRRLRDHNPGRAPRQTEAVSK